MINIKLKNIKNKTLVNEVSEMIAFCKKEKTKILDLFSKDFKDLVFLGKYTFLKRKNGNLIITSDDLSSDDQVSALYELIQIDDYLINCEAIKKELIIPA